MKFPKEDRTFESRLKYISSIALNPYPKEAILQKCVEHRLKMNCKQYMEDLDRLTRETNLTNATKNIKKLYKNKIKKVKF